MGKLCSTRSCSIQREEGYASAFVIAHEMGHVLGLTHDGDTQQSNECIDDPNIGSIMAPLVRSSFNKYRWSHCSNRELKNQLPHFECLRKPTKGEFSRGNGAGSIRQDTVQYRSISPMVIDRNIEQNPYTFDEQCRITWGKEYANCDAATTKAQCEQLWCRPLENPDLCKTKNQPPLENTTCMTEGHQRGRCFGGFCMPENTQQMMGQWGGWGAWNECNQICGTGARYRRRDCSAMQCEGGEEAGRDVHICNTRPCENQVDRRTYQCQQETGSMRAIPFMNTDNDNECQLSCRMFDGRSGKPALIENTVVPDGTLCKYSEPHGPICIAGKCRSADCEMNIGSRGIKRADKCGVCDGDNSMCEHVSIKKTKKYVFII